MWSTALFWWLDSVRTGVAVASFRGVRVEPLRRQDGPFLTFGHLSACCEWLSGRPSGVHHPFVEESDGRHCYNYNQVPPAASLGGSVHACKYQTAQAV